MILRNALQVVEICNGFALYGQNEQGESVFLAHLGDGVDGLPDAADPELAEVYGFSFCEESALVTTCPQCDGMGELCPGATCGMWAGLVHWPEHVLAQLCDLCDGHGEVAEALAAAYIRSLALDD